MKHLFRFILMLRVIHAFHRVSINASRLFDHNTITVTRRQNVRHASSTSDLESFLRQRKTEEKCWRPTVQDVERISFGLPAKVKGTGSRGIPHRLNEEERMLYDIARRKGFLEVAGSGWRSQRRDAPLLNTYRSLCDARGQACIVLHKGNAATSGIEVQDSVVIDLSPLRMSTNTLQEIATGVIHDMNLEGGRLIGETILDYNSLTEDGTEAMVIAKDELEPFLTRPIYQLSPLCVQWDLIRLDAKSLGKKLASIFQTAEENKLPGSKSQKPSGVKPGKSRRHGGYGIG
jgi:hypothetical protein